MYNSIETIFEQYATWNLSKNSSLRHFSFFLLLLLLFEALCLLRKYLSNMRHGVSQKIVLSTILVSFFFSSLIWNFIPFEKIFQQYATRNLPKTSSHGHLGFFLFLLLLFEAFFTFLGTISTIWHLRHGVYQQLIFFFPISVFSLLLLLNTTTTPVIFPTLMHNARQWSSTRLAVFPHSFDSAHLLGYKSPKWKPTFTFLLRTRHRVHR